MVYHLNQNCQNSTQTLSDRKKTAFLSFSSCLKDAQTLKKVLFYGIKSLTLMYVKHFRMIQDKVFSPLLSKTSHAKV